MELQNCPNFKSCVGNEPHGVPVKGAPQDMSLREALVDDVEEGAGWGAGGRGKGAGGQTFSLVFWHLVSMQ